jgi:hypothetical protein
MKTPTDLLNSTHPTKPGQSPTPKPKPQVISALNQTDTSS